MNNEKQLELPTLETSKINCIPPIIIKRNSFGLLENVNYTFDENGFVNYKAMVPAEFIYINSSDPRRKERLEKKYGKPIKEINYKTDNVNDSDLVISLGGIKYLLKLRGYEHIDYTIKESNSEYSSVACYITFIPNFETENRCISFGDNACAHLKSTTGFGQKYLVEIATNRAFCRTVRNFLGINIVSQEEISNNDESITSEKQQEPVDKFLTEIMEKQNISFEKVKKTLIAEKYINSERNLTADQITCIEDIDKTKKFHLIERIKEKAKI